jgi:hypothetical protein
LDKHFLIIPFRRLSKSPLNHDQNLSGLSDR